MTAERTPDARVEAWVYTPTTEEIRNNMAFGAACAVVALDQPDKDLADAMRNIDWPAPGLRPRAKAQFDAWLAVHDAEIIAAADAVQREGLAERVADQDTLEALPVGSVVECTWFTWADQMRPWGKPTKPISRLFMVTEHMLVAERYEVAKRGKYGALARFDGGIRVLYRHPAVVAAIYGPRP